MIHSLKLAHHYQHRMVVGVQEKSACVLIDLCAGPLAPWLAMIIAKVWHFLEPISFTFKEFE